jgi:hypothetical protein
VVLAPPYVRYFLLKFLWGKNGENKKNKNNFIGTSYNCYRGYPYTYGAELFYQMAGGKGI